jgi:hypothetical protein
LPSRQNAPEDPNPGPAFANAGTGGRGMDCRLSPLVPRVLVSEYQYYDFRAIDRPLTKKEMGSLRSISTRNHHNELHEPLRMEDLKADPSKLELSLGEHALQFYFLFSGVLRNHSRTAAG